MTADVDNTSVATSTCQIRSWSGEAIQRCERMVMMFAAQHIAARITMPAPARTSPLLQSIDSGFRITTSPTSPSMAPAILAPVSLSCFNIGAASATHSGVV